MRNIPKILVAEDDENDRFIVQRAFDKSGINAIVTFANDGKETIDVLQQNDQRLGNAIQPALLLLDLRMPGLDGFQVLSWLQQQPSCRPGRVVVLSSSSDPRDLKETKALGADDYKVKPHDTNGYIKMIQDFGQQFGWI